MDYLKTDQIIKRYYSHHYHPYAGDDFCPIEQEYYDGILKKMEDAEARKPAKMVKPKVSIFSKLGDIFKKTAHPPV